MYVALTKAKSLRLISYASDRYDEKRDVDIKAL